SVGQTSCAKFAARPGRGHAACWVSAIRTRIGGRQTRYIGSFGAGNREKIGFPLISHVAHVILERTRPFCSRSWSIGLLTHDGRKGVNRRNSQGRDMALLEPGPGKHPLIETTGMPA